MIFAICDDTSETLDILKNALQKRYGNNCDCVCFSEAGKLKYYIENKQLPDCIIMDICIGDKNGIVELRKIQQKLIDSPVIFITGYPEYCQDIFIDFEPFGLLTKPIDFDKLYYYTDRIAAGVGQRDVRISVTLGKERNVLKSSNIMYIESEKRKIIYHTKDGNFEEYSKMSDALDKLKIGFIRCHKSFAVNYKHVKTFSNEKIVMYDNTVIPVSRMYGESAKSRFYTLKSNSLGM
jgi:DNA-binding LytR/AlgR family response regulator